MASWLFGTTHAANPPTYFEIRLDDNTLWLPESGENSNYGNLNGSVVLCLSRPVAVKDLKLHVKGVHYVNWDSTTPDGRHNKTQWRERIFYHQIWSLIRVWKGNSTTLQPGNYEFPFSVSLHKRMPASIEGMDDCYIRYGLTAALNCSRGLITESRNLTVSRLHDIFSFLDPQGIEAFWADKITYRLSIPGRALLLGSPIKVDMRYIPILKGVYPETMQVQLVETHAVFPRTGLPRAISKTRERVVSEGITEHEESGAELYTNDDGEEWRLLSHILPTSSSLDYCRPSSRTSVVEVTHALKIRIRLRNSSGKYSEISAAFPLTLCSVPETDSRRSSLQDACLDGIVPPPAYADHVRDQIFLDTSITPPLSRTSTGSEDIGFADDRIDGSWQDLVSNLLQVPCYDRAVMTAAPRSSGSPSYWAHCTCVN